MNNQNQISDILFASVQRLSADELQEISVAIGGMERVVSSHPGGDEGHFFKVAYDPSCVNSHAILEKLKGLGVEARMVEL
ncbi:hypothetical protein [Acidithiobacillus sulfuriphilus]|uniref:hypothetical protein n=1 Tax=Acidithiobacillus sulfuriphilus TaxID=1867749 RepID=UPI003F5E01F4